MTLDMMLPVMTGLAATEYIMAHCPTPILIVSASTNRGELFKTYERWRRARSTCSRSRAATSATATGSGGSSRRSSWSRASRSSPTCAARLGAAARPRGRRADAQAAGAARAPLARSSPSARRPGGPAALVEVLRALPPTSRCRSCSCSTSASRSAPRSPTGSTRSRTAACPTRGTASRRRLRGPGGSWRRPTAT